MGLNGWLTAAVALFVACVAMLIDGPPFIAIILLAGAASVLLVAQQERPHSRR